MPRRLAAHPLALALFTAPAACGWIESEGRMRIESRFQPGEVIVSEPAANYFGLESRGGGQSRGNGALVLTADQLWFHLLVPTQELTIRLADVTDVALVDGHLGKSVGRALLRVRFRGEAGEDAAAWLVADPERWQREIAARSGARPAPSPTD